MKFLVLCTLVAGAAAAISNSINGDGRASKGAAGLYNQESAGIDYADKFPHGNTGYNGGYTTQFSTPNGAGVAVGTGNFAGAPGYGGFGGFNNGFGNYWANSMTQSYSGPGATVRASASLVNPAWTVPTPQELNLFQQQLAFQQQLFAQQQALFGGFGAGNFPTYGPNFGYGSFGAVPNAGFGGASTGGFGGASTGSFGGASTGSFGGAPNVASSSASFGPGGFHQTASIYPNNPAVPNIDTRFGGSEQATSFQSGKPGFVGVSSFSSSSNINGQTHREAVTSVNDNGKVTTHRVHS